MTPAGRKQLEQAFLRVLHARHPSMVWKLSGPDDADAIANGNLARGRSLRHDDTLNSGGK